MPSQGSREDRGYDHEHRKLRSQWEPRVDTGTVRCARCGKLIRPTEPWDLGHTSDRDNHTGPEHADCNRIAGGRQPKPNRSRRQPEPHPGLTTARPR